MASSHLVSRACAQASPEQQTCLDQRHIVVLNQENAQPVAERELQFPILFTSAPSMCMHTSMEGSFRRECHETQHAAPFLCLAGAGRLVQGTLLGWVAGVPAAQSVRCWEPQHLLQAQG